MYFYCDNFSNQTFDTRFLVSLKTTTTNIQLYKTLYLKTKVYNLKTKKNRIINQINVRKQSIKSETKKHHTFTKVTKTKQTLFVRSNKNA